MLLLTHEPMSKQRQTGYMSLRITPILMGHVSLGGLNEGCFHQGRCQVVRRFGVYFQAPCLLGSLRFWSPINSGLQTFQAIFLDFLAFGAFPISPVFCIFPVCNSGRYSHFPTVSPSFPALLQANLVSTSGHFSQMLVSSFFSYIGFFFFIVHLVAVRFVFGVCDFLGTKWMLRGPKCRVLVFFWGKTVIVRGKIGSICQNQGFSCFFSVGPLKGIPKPFGLRQSWWYGEGVSLVRACFASSARYLAQVWV